MKDRPYSPELVPVIQGDGEGVPPHACGVAVVALQGRDLREVYECHAARVRCGASGEARASSNSARPSSNLPCWMAEVSQAHQRGRQRSAVCALAQTALHPRRPPGHGRCLRVGPRGCHRTTSHRRRNWDRRPGARSPGPVRKRPALVSVHPASTPTRWRPRGLPPSAAAGSPRDVERHRHPTLGFLQLPLSNPQVEGQRPCEPSYGLAIATLGRPFQCPRKFRARL